MNEHIVALRQRFSEFLGAEQFKKFIKLSARSGKLRHWQQTAWDKFVATNPEYANAMDDLRLAIRICEVHGDDLVPENVPVNRNELAAFRHVFGPGLAQLDIAAEHYPNAESSGTVFLGNTPNVDDTFQIWYCPTCREREAEWKAFRKQGRDEKYDDL